MTGLAGTWPGRADDLIERVERSRWRNLVACAAAYRQVYTDARTTTRHLAGGVAAFTETGSSVNHLSAAGLTEPITDQVPGVGRRLPRTVAEELEADGCGCGGPAGVRLAPKRPKLTASRRSLTRPI